MKYTVNEAQEGKRLDLYLAQAAEISRSLAARHIEEGRVLLNGSPAGKNVRVSAGQSVELDPPPPVPAAARPEEIPLDIVYEDADLVVVNKPAGMVVHPAAGNPDGTLVNALLAHCGDSLSGIGGELRPGIVHRIDKETSGLIAVAKNDRAHLALSAQLKDKTMHRVYLAVAAGGFPADSGRIDKPIGRSPKDRKKMAVVPADRGRSAATRYTVLERYPGWTLLRLELDTGRTHQIRVHLSSVGHPLMGDRVYGGAPGRFETLHKDLLPGQLLHAKELELIHPATGEKMRFTSPLPPNFERILEILRQTSN